MDEQLNQFINNCIFRMVNGDEYAAEEIYNALKGKMLTIALRYIKVEQDAEEIINCTLYKVINSAKTYHNSTNPVAWILTILKNTCIDFLRGRKRFVEVSLNDNNLKYQTQSYEYDDTAYYIDFLLSKLESPERRLIILKYFLDYTFDALSARLHLSRSTIHYREKRVLKKLKKLAKEYPQ
ncbi:MAG: RNA polymerase sigma factor [Clostridia bacterium]|nr:RNA polymerase sigma factor [Clostridia bacterium]